MKRLILTVCLMFAAGNAAAQSPTGTWASPPDSKGQTGHLVIRDCGNSYCGDLVRAFSPEGEEIVTDAVGRRILRGMVATGAGTYEGRVYVPKIDQTVDATVRLAGDQLTVRGCAGPICDSQTWTRVD